MNINAALFLVVRGMGEFSDQETAPHSAPRYPFLSLFTKQMISIKSSEDLIPEGALDEQDPSQQPYWDVAQGSDHTDPLPDWQSNFSAAPALSVTFMEKFISFSVEASIFILLV